MQRIKKSIERYQENRKEKQEVERRKRVEDHPHLPGCTLSRDIELFDKRYESSYVTHPMFGSMPYLADYKTRCQECAATSDKRAEDQRRRERKAQIQAGQR